MSIVTTPPPALQLESLGFPRSGNIHYQMNPEELIEDSICMGEGLLGNTGALVINTGRFTGRSPKDKFIVKDAVTADTVHWGNFNIPLAEKYFDKNKKNRNTNTRYCYHS